MDINEFAGKYGVKVKRDECNDAVVIGKRGNVFDGFNGGRLGVCLLFATAHKWNRVRTALQASGFAVRQNGHTEGCATFDPSNKEQARLVLKVVGVRTQRQAIAPSAAQLAARAAFVQRRRSMALQSA